MCADNDGRLTLTTTAEDLQAEALTFSYKVTAGKIEGEGTQVIWDLHDAANGQYTATVWVKNKSGVSAKATLTVTIADCSSCDPPSVFGISECPKVIVDCPSEIESGKLITFRAKVSGSKPRTEVSYLWSTDAGRIVDGKFDKKMTLDLLRFPFEKVTAKVSVGGYHPSCICEASCTTKIKE